MKLVEFVVRGFRRPGEMLEFTLGPLERQIMDLLWDRSGETSVRDVHAAMQGALAYTTLMTTLDRLHKKGFLDRRKEGRAFLYAARLQRAEFEHALASHLIGGLLTMGGNGVRPILSTIVEAVGARDREALEDLERLIQQKRREMKAGKEGR